MPETGVRIIRQETHIDFDTDQRSIESVRVTFKVDGDGPFTKLFPREGFNGATARLALEDFAREVRALRG